MEEDGIVGEFIFFHHRDINLRRREDDLDETLNRTTGAVRLATRATSRDDVTFLEIEYYPTWHSFCLLPYTEKPSFKKESSQNQTQGQGVQAAGYLYDPSRVGAHGPTPPPGLKPG